MTPLIYLKTQGLTLDTDLSHVIRHFTALSCCQSVSNDTIHDSMTPFMRMSQETFEIDK
jgi:hypothetical protein